jgi:integrase
MFNTNFNLKSVNHVNERPINLVMRWNNNRLIYAIGEKILPQHFETDKGKKLWQRVKPSYPGYSEFNALLDYFESTAATVFRQFVNENHRVPKPSELKERLDIKLRNANEKKKPTLLQFISTFIEEAQQGKINTDSGKKLAKGTILVYRRTLDRLKEYEIHHKQKLDFDSIDMEFYGRWIEYLSFELGLSKNTVGKYTKILKMFLNEATDREINTTLTFRNKKFRVLTESVYKIYLNERELNEMYALDLSENQRLERVRDLFIFGCWTGLRFKDLVNITAENIQGDKLSIKTQKTGEVVVLPLHWMVREIMTKYSDQPNSLPPGISNVKMNRYLKEIAAMLPCLREKVQVNITRGGQLITESRPKHACVCVHTARRSLATNLYLDGVSSLMIMKLTAHKSEKVFLSYLKATAEENANLVQKHWHKKEAESALGNDHKAHNAVIYQQPPSIN